MPTTTTTPFADEEAIVWLEDIERLDYVRAEAVPTQTRREKPPFSTFDGARLVGFSVLRQSAKPVDCGWPADSGFPRMFARRVFWMDPWDRDSEPTGTYQNSCPCEAVDPRTVAPGVEGEQTQRCWGGKWPSKHGEATALSHT